jgi:hypothetical protein
MINGSARTLRRRIPLIRPSRGLATYIYVYLNMRKNESSARRQSSQDITPCRPKDPKCPACSTVHRLRHQMFICTRSCILQRSSVHGWSLTFGSAGVHGGDVQTNRTRVCTIVLGCVGRAMWTRGHGAKTGAVRAQIYGYVYIYICKYS